MPFTHVRTLVSGNKARYIDEEPDINLDLVYVTDRIIIMGYPATGVKALYRNRRDDVLRFLNARHGDKWWIWNLCPLTENAYSSESMEGRVSRYPFPDHNPPPLPLLPLAVREMTAWLEGDAERIAIIHCKAGKGRSGTLLVSYLLSLPELPPPPKEVGPELETSVADDIKVTVKETVEPNTRDTEEQDADETEAELDAEGLNTSDDETVAELVSGGQTKPQESSTSTLGGEVQREKTHVSGVSTPLPDQPKQTFVPLAIGDEGGVDEVGQQDRKDGKLDEIFKFHSSRRMKPSTTKARRGVSIASQRRWCRYLHLLFLKQGPVSYLENKGQVRLVSVTLVLKRPASWQKPLASLVVGGRDGGQGKAGASIARYRDEYVEKLRELGGAGEGVEGDITWGGVGGDGKYDSQKMFKIFAKLGPAELDEGAAGELLPGEQDEFNVHHLVPTAAEGREPPDIVLDRGREFRIKLHLGSLPMGWAWFIPAFHLGEPSSGGTPFTFDVPRSQLDFPLGPGSAVKRVIMRLEELDPIAT